MTTHSRAAIRSYRDLAVWQLGMDVVALVYRLTERFPRHELYALTSQMRKAAVSVPSNVAEGHTRDTSAQFAHFLADARASIAEIETQIEIAIRLDYLPREAALGLLADLDRLSRMLSTLRGKILGGGRGAGDGGRGTA